MQVNKYKTDILVKPKAHYQFELMSFMESVNVSSNLPF